MLKSDADATNVGMVVDRLRDRFGRRAFDIVEHWDADICAVGITAPGQEARLVYISTCGLPAGRYAVSLDQAPAADAPAGAPECFSGLDFDAVAALVAQHLGVEAHDPER